MMSPISLSSNNLVLVAPEEVLRSNYHRPTGGISGEPAGSKNRTADRGNFHHILYEPLKRRKLSISYMGHSTVFVHRQNF